MMVFPRDRNLWVLYLATLIIGVAFGLSIALVAIHLDSLAFSKPDIGELAAWFAFGIMIFSIPCGRLIRRFSAKTTLIVSILGYAGCVAAFPFLRSFHAIALLRACDGACSVGIWVSSETALLERSDKKNKASTMSLYAISMALGYMVGPLCARGIAALASVPMAFVTASMFAVMSSVIMVVLYEPGTQTSDPHSSGKPAAIDTMKTAEILNRTKTSCFGTFAYGYFQSSVVLFLPLFLIAQKDISKERTIIIPAFFAAGMLLFSNVAGRFGDKWGHLLLMRILATLGMCMIVGFVFIDAYFLMAVAVFVAGATLASISPVSLAMQGVVLQPVQYSRANGLYNTFYAAGMILGPPISGWIFDRHGGQAMLFHLALLWAAFVIFTFLFRRDDPAYRRGRAPVMPMVQSPVS